MNVFKIAFVVVVLLQAPVCLGQEFVECTEDSDCSRGPCIDGQCVVVVSKYETTQQSANGRDASWYRTKTEWFGLRIMGGNYGLGCGIGLFALRWKHFFWEILHLAYGEVGESKGYVQVGTAAGVPLHLGDSGRHELRLAVALMFGHAWHGTDDQTGRENTNYPYHLAPSIWYVFHAVAYFALELGVELSIGLHNSEGDYAPPVLNGFVGFRI